MKKELVQELFVKFENARIVIENVECWSARELQQIFNYSDWRNFQKVIEKARISCEASAHAVSYHFVDVNEMIMKRQ